VTQCRQQRPQNSAPVNVSYSQRLQGDPVVSIHLTICNHWTIRWETRLKNWIWTSHTITSVLHRASSTRSAARMGAWHVKKPTVLTGFSTIQSTGGHHVATHTHTHTCAHTQVAPLTIFLHKLQTRASSTDIHGLFLLSNSVFDFIFFPFFVSVQCAKLNWSSRQLLSAR